jgi:tetratricopeptide (TPR) repeat protein
MKLASPVGPSGTIVGVPQANPQPALELDLAGPVDDELDLPAVASTRRTDDLDLPAALSSSAFDELDLPAPVHSGRVDELDLPAALPSSAFDELDLPAASKADDLFGDLDLPVGSRGGGAASHAGVGELDLPIPYEDGLGDLDLPLPVAGGVARAARDSLDDVPAFSPSFDLPRPASSVDLPRPAADLPKVKAPARGSFDVDDGWASSIPASPPASQHAAASEAADFGDVDLGDIEADLGGAAEADLGAEADIFGALDVDADLSLRDLAPRGNAPAATKSGEAPKSVKGAVTVFLVLLLLVGAGAALALTPHGLFGRYYFEQFLASAGTTADTERILAAAEAKARSDTYDDARASLRELADARRALGLNRLLLSRSIVQEALFQRRFGPDSASSERIVRALGRLEERHGDAPSMELARAAAALVKNDTGAALSQIERARASAASLLDVELVAGEAHLASGNAQAAQAAFARAAELGGGARASYGQIRSVLAAGGDAESLDALLRGTLETSPRHVAARTEWALLLLSRGEIAEARGLAREAAGIDAVDGAFLRGARLERARAFAALGLIEERAASRKDALAAFEDSMQLDPMSTIPVYGAGRVLLADNRARDALVRFEAATRAAQPHELHKGRPVALAAQLDATKAELFLGAVDEARARIAPLVEQYPEDALVRLRAGEAFASSQSVEQAATHFERAIELDPASFHAYVGLAQLLFDADRAEEAGAVLKSAEGKVPMTAEVRILRGHTELRRGRAARALDEFDAALVLQADDAGGLFGRAVSLRRLGRFDEAEGVFDALVEIDASYPGVAVERGLIHEARGNAELAASEYRKALDERSDDPELLIRLGAAEVRIGEFDAGEERLKRAFEALPNSPEVIHYLGRVAFAKGDIPAALEKLERAAVLEPRNGTYRAELGRARLAAGDIVGARREVLRALELDDSLGDAYWVKGRIALRTGAVRDAIDDLEKALRLTPGRHEALSDLGEAFEQLNKTAYAIRAYEQAVQAAPREGRYAYRLGRLLLEDGKRREAQAALEIAAELGSTKSNAPVWLADVYRLLGDAYRGAKNPSEARKAYERFLEIAPADSIDRADVTRRLRSL